MAAIAPTNLYRAHQEWATRPDDERFETLDALKNAVQARRTRCATVELPLSAFQAQASGRSLTFQAGVGELVPTHWAFSQIAQTLHAPAGYLRELPGPLAAECLNVGFRSRRDPALAYVATEGTPDTFELRALTSSSYGRIYDEEVVTLVERVVERTDGRFFNPKDWSGRPSGLYASDRDVFCFLIDGGSLVDGGTARDQLHRGFFVWNSEVGAATFGISLFLFRVVCGNHIVWDAEQVRTLKIRHTSHAPTRFITEMLPLLRSYIDASARPVERQIGKAQDYLLPADRDERLTWLQGRGFTKSEARQSLDTAEEEESDSRTLWQVINGLTAVARDKKHTNERVALERKAGALLQLVA